MPAELKSPVVNLSEREQQELDGKVQELTILLKRYFKFNIPYPGHEKLERHNALVQDLERRADWLTTEQQMAMAKAYGHPNVRNKQKQGEWSARIEQRGASTFTFDLAKAYYEGVNTTARQEEKAVKLFKELVKLKDQEALRKQVIDYLNKPAHKALKLAVFPLSDAQKQFLSKAKITERLFDECGISRMPLISVHGDEDEGIIHFLPSNSLSKKDLHELVMTPNGHLYSRQALMDWLQKQTMEPKTRNPLTPEELISLTEEHVDFEELHQRLGLRALDNGFKAAMLIIEKAQVKLGEVDNANLTLLKTQLEQQAEQVKAALKKPEKLEKNTYPQLLKQAKENIKDNPLTKSLKAEESTFLRVIKKYVPFKWVRHTLSKFFAQPALTPEKAVIKDTVNDLKNSIKLTIMPK